MYFVPFLFEKFFPSLITQWTITKNVRKKILEDQPENGRNFNEGDDLIFDIELIMPSGLLLRGISYNHKKSNIIIHLIGVDENISEEKKLGGVLKKRVW